MVRDDGCFARRGGVRIRRLGREYVGDCGRNRGQRKGLSRVGRRHAVIPHGRAGLAADWTAIRRARLVRASRPAVATDTRVVVLHGISVLAATAPPATVILPVRGTSTTSWPGKRWCR